MTAKTIPIAITGAYRGLYKLSTIQYMNVFLITAGLFIFQFFKPTKSTEEYSANFIGITLIVITLMSDGLSST